jgi:hypothetical protein
VSKLQSVLDYVFYGARTLPDGVNPLIARFLAEWATALPPAQRWLLLPQVVVLTSTTTTPRHAAVAVSQRLALTVVNAFASWWICDQTAIWMDAAMFDDIGRSLRTLPMSRLSEPAPLLSLVERSTPRVEAAWRQEHEVAFDVDLMPIDGLIADQLLASGSEAAYNTLASIVDRRQWIDVVAGLECMRQCAMRLVMERSPALFALTVRSVQLSGLELLSRLFKLLLGVRTRAPVTDEPS